MPTAATIVTAARRIPWTKVIAAGTLAYQRGSAAWEALTPAERARLRDLIAKSKGRPSNLTERERKRVRELAAKTLQGVRGK